MAEDQKAPEEPDYELSPEDQSTYTAMMADNVLAWLATVLEGQALVLAKLSGRPVEQERADLLTILDKKQAAMREIRLSWKRGDEPLSPSLWEA